MFVVIKKGQQCRPALVAYQDCLRPPEDVLPILVPPMPSDSVR